MPTEHNEQEKACQLNTKTRGKVNSSQMKKGQETQNEVVERSEFFKKLNKIWFS